MVIIGRNTLQSQLNKVELWYVQLQFWDNELVFTWKNEKRRDGVGVMHLSEDLAKIKERALFGTY